MTKRKVIQIAIAAESDTIEGLMVALCDDGSIWYKNFAANEEVQEPWRREELPPGCDPNEEMQ